MAVDYWTPQQVIDEARNVYLNDAGGQRYTDPRMFLLFKSSFDIILLKLIEANVPYTKLTLPESTTILSTDTFYEIATGSANPTSILPIRVRERPVGATLWSDMIESDPLPINLTPNINRGYWRWGGTLNAHTIADQASVLNFPVGTTDTELLIDVRIAAMAIPLASTSVRLPGLRSYFAARLAAIAATFIGNNPTRGQQCEAIASVVLDSYLNIHSKKEQSRPHRRLAFNWWKRAQRWRL